MTIVAAGLAAAGLPVAIVNPRQIRDFARATARLAKTDILDAAVMRPQHCIQSFDQFSRLSILAWATLKGRIR